MLVTSDWALDAALARAATPISTFVEADMDTPGTIRTPRPPRSAPRRRHFTLEHANRTLPLVRRIVADIVRQHKLVSSLEDKCHIRRPDVPREKQEELTRQYAIELEKLGDLADELTAVGCEIKDWRIGLIDFRSLHQGREIELCWRLGEDRIAFWHEVNAGFAGRQPIDEGSFESLPAVPVAG